MNIDNTTTNDSLKKVAKSYDEWALKYQKYSKTTVDDFSNV